MTESQKPAYTDEELAFFESIFDLAREGKTEELTALIARGCPVDLVNSRGDTLLILAAYRQHLDTVGALLALGADTARVNDNGQTALMSAVFRNNAPIVAALLAAGADPTLGANTALEVARQFGLADMEKLLG